MITPIIILTLLASPLLAESIVATIQRRQIRLEKAVLTGLIIAFLFFAAGHFIRTEDMIAMLPGWIPLKVTLVYVSGLWEIMIALGLIIKQFRKLALILALTTLVLFFFVNIYAALNYSGPGGHQWGPVYLFVRGPLQIILIAWCIWSYRLNRFHIYG